MSANSAVIRLSLSGISDGICLDESKTLINKFFRDSPSLSLNDNVFSLPGYQVIIKSRYLDLLPDDFQRPTKPASLSAKFLRDIKSIILLS